MATNVVFNGVTYSIPTEGDSDWAPDLSAYFISLANNTLQKSGGNFFLTSELSFGPNFGIRAAYLRSSSTTNPASAGYLRLGNAQSIAWRNAANSADLTLQVDGSDNLNFNGSSLSVGGTPIQTELTFSDTDTIDLENASNVITASIKAGSIVDSLISASAAISLSKLEAVTADRALISSSSGTIEPSAVTTIELGRLSGVTSGIQGQLDAKVAKTVTALKIYGTDGSGNQTTYGLPLFPSASSNILYGTNGSGQAEYPVASASTANAVPLRTVDQQLKALTVGDAHGSASSEDLANRAYVQGAVAAVKAIVVVANIAARDAIPSGSRYEGMVVYVTADKMNYQLQGGIANANYIEFGGAQITTITNVTATGSVTFDSGLLVITASSADIVITLPTAVLKKSIPYMRTDSTDYTVTFQRAGSDTIQGATTFTVPNSYTSGRLTVFAANTWGNFNA